MQDENGRNVEFCRGSNAASLLGLQLNSSFCLRNGKTAFPSGKAAGL